MFEDDVYDVPAPRWEVRWTVQGFRVVDTHSQIPLKVHYDLRADADEMCNILNEYEKATFRAVTTHGR